jgi:hypothetical protein
MARAKIFASLVFRSARKFQKIPRTLPHHSTNWTAVPSSLWWPLMRRSFHINSSASLADIFIAFSTANPGAAATGHVVDLKMLPNDQLDPVFAATVQATEEAVINAMVAAETMTGIENHKVISLPHDKLREVLKKYNRLTQ